MKERLRLVPLSPAVAATVDDVEAGRDTSQAISRHRGISTGAASQRLIKAGSQGLIRYVEAHREGRRGRPCKRWELRTAEGEGR